jgi:CO dehydrogenase maturation factor
MGVVTREFLKKLELGSHEVMLVDMDAGIEYSARSIETSVDAVVCVVEPSLESLTMAAKIKELTQSSGASFKGAVLNKVVSPGQQTTLYERLNDSGVPILGTIHHRDEIVAACLEGKTLDVPEASAEMEGIEKTLLL